MAKVKYGEELYGLGVCRDAYADHFAEPDDIKVNYMLTFYGDVLHECEHLPALSSEIEKMVKRLTEINKFLKREEKKNEQRKK